MENLTKQRVSKHVKEMRALNQSYLNKQIDHIEYARRRAALENKICEEVTV